MRNNNEAQEQTYSIWQKLHIDLVLLLGILSLMALGLFIVYSAGGQDIDIVYRQAIRLGVALVVMVAVAQIPPLSYKKWAVPVFVIGILLLVSVLLFGHVGKGAQRWLDLGFMKFQPSEIMKLIVPIMIAWFISQESLPVKKTTMFFAFILVLMPTLLIAKQPDLGTSLLIASSGIFVIFLAGASWKLIGVCVGLGSAFAPILWMFLMKDYQRQRVMTFLNPEQDPLGSGYHIIQSKIAIGSGGVTGKGWLQGTQSQLEFLPERHTDFIFAVFSEEFGLVGVGILLAVYLLIVMRGLWIATHAQDAFTKLLAGSITLTFFVYVFVNIGMVSGLLPVVGVPLPLVSFGGTSMVTLLAGFGMLMAISTHRRFHV
ncbi:rod shape-determining protein RodA [Colwellia sp. 4_MG-2023]|jgi:rod shape determining protein RodA|uniref:rod shape-determining protein RodA n=1 Tax=unclassified Colwellia TaxID=196834 RepID=UPI001C0A5775|nr:MULTISPECIES: rod shape-determining protein RodA [unclassified Colwellia]MBU2923870.1 rod shape-determining protein RodA [Colwellia sp. C2M11]MDO6488799.1 rod shape-determining protein RodA [Colwellia sp. 6_MG-2023]MDO6507669.1 rod shape-determining protein RodA [Colwellia sp. 5_MG-2023]MDO6555665.1 rod shape-determining protein RodA [Colwellia sp. 4_MG-2023]MDO6653058.1 rod shape-determining protein RodA [Colwellia sp. 3_MG-2023]